MKPPNLTTGINTLDDHLGNLFIGDNLIWYDVAGNKPVQNQHRCWWSE